MFYTTRKEGDSLLARSHVGIGFLGGLLFKGSLLMSSGPAALLLIIFTLVPGMIRYVFLIALTTISIAMPDKAAQLAVPLALLAGSLFPDIDHPNSTGSAFIAPTETILRLMVGTGGVALAYFTYPSVWGTAVGLFLILTAAINLKWYPAEKVQRLMLIAGGLLLIKFDVGMIGSVMGIMYVGMGILSHRGLTHSSEGLLIASLGTWVWATKTGHPQLVAPYVLGYALHLLADMIADSGIYLSYFAKLKYGISLVQTSGVVDRVISVGTLVVALLLTVPGLEITQKILKVVQSFG